MVVDKNTLPGIQHLNILVGSLETPKVSYLCNCQTLPCASNSKSIAQAVDDGARSLGINRNSFIAKLHVSTRKQHACRQRH